MLRGKKRSPDRSPRRRDPCDFERRSQSPLADPSEDAAGAREISLAPPSSSFVSWLLRIKVCLLKKLQSQKRRIDGQSCVSPAGDQDFVWK
jgi:hypothetical protein